jgi:integrase
MKSVRGMGNVYQPSYRDRKTGELKNAATWWIVYSIHGRRIAENAHSTNRADAVRLLKKKTGDASAGKPVGPELDRTNLDDLLAMIESDYKANGKRSLDRVQQAAHHLRGFFSRGVSGCKARDITADRITSYAARRLEEGAQPATVNYEMAVLRRAFRLGVRAGKVGVRPEFSMLEVDNTRKGFFEPEQYRAVLAHLPEYLTPVAQTLHTTGWRISELLTRQWRHVDLVNGWLRLEPGESKNREGREFPFTPDLRALLEAQRERVREIERATDKIVPWVFVHPDGSPIRDFRYSWAKACRAAGVPGRLVHDFRRTAVRNLERAGVSRSAAMKLTGHLTEAIYRRYAITDSAMLQEAAAKLATFHAADAESNVIARPMIGRNNDESIENCKSLAKVSALSRA